MKHPLRVIIIALLVLLIIPGIGFGTASAHELETDKGISTILHIAPDDSPVTGVETLMIFDFTNRDPGFDVRYCKCRISYQNSENRLNSSSIVSQDNSATTGYATTKFDKPGVYDIEVTGFINAKLDEIFTLNYLVRVTQGQAPGQKTAITVQIILLGVTTLLVLGIVASEMIRRGTRYSAKPARVASKK